MYRLFLFLIALATCQNVISQNVERPRLVVGIVVDQMRWDYLYRYYDRYEENGGFKKMISKGFACENTMIPYAPTITACGHSTVYTGSAPAISGITGNTWWDKYLMRSVYCTEDKSVKTVGSTSTAGLQSPRNLLVTTICDELRLATNFQSKVIGIAIKDRGGILTAGHSANAAYWYDGSVGNWITSSYYMDELPGWVKTFNNQKLVDKYYKQGWKLSYSPATYKQSTDDEKKYEAKPFGNKFPYELNKFIGTDYSKIASTPMGNSLTIEFAKSAIDAEDLGKDDITDFLAISFSSPDYIGHTFGPNSMEAEDGFLKLDKELGDFFNYLDKKIGNNNYTVFLTADHGVAQVPEFMEENKLPGERVYMSKIVSSLNNHLFEKYGVNKLIVSYENYQIHLNHQLLDSAHIDEEDISDWIVDELAKEPGIARVFRLDELNEVPLPNRIKEMINNGYYPPRSGDIQFILKPGYIEGYSELGTTHGLWNPYDAHIPLLWYGWGVKHGISYKDASMSDIAPTVAALLKIQMPSGSIGKVITEVIK
ncbi:MAG TPA: alkaline phosphatase family protein [Chitinophagaceae bacterium]|nr:alkaline phosphatase family protein [Chitinophagaceae bacterium]MCB9055938.1 alkaline phosphatase family protein [Chitinophagales bacterium]HPG10434.1 alkaline phosphatase family protein [Chitinophagaceae bacterium]